LQGGLPAILENSRLALDVSSRTVVLLHEGELADVRSLALSLGAQVAEASSQTEAPADWDVLVATARQARSAPAGSRAGAVRIAVVERDSRVLRRVLRRSGADVVIRRPVHPMALRLLLLHALYRGPERRTRRVAVGAPVRFRARLLKRSAILADLSLRGCLLLTRHCAPIGQSVTVWIPLRERSGSDVVAVRGAVVRRIPPAAGGPGMALDFGTLGPALARSLATALAEYLDGPAAGDASLAPEARDRGDTQPIAPSDGIAAPGDDPPAADSSGATPERDAGDPASASCAARADPAGGSLPPASDRRRSPRHVFAGRRVIALSQEAACVLMGRDLSTTGMRIDRAPGLSLGQRLSLAIHVSPADTPIVVRGEIVRDDGCSGFALRFFDLSPASERHLAKMIDTLPMLETEEGRLVVSQIVPNG
jgi:hypothetical protein